MGGLAMNATYLGDGLYVECDGYQLRLFTDRGQDGVHEAYLDPDVFTNLLSFVETLKEGHDEHYQ